MRGSAINDLPRTAKQALFYKRYYLKFKVILVQVTFSFLFIQRSD